MSSFKFGQLSVLVVDDFSSFRATLIAMLNRLGITHIEEASRAQEAIKWCKEREFDVILCDYNLGSGRNGQHVLEELRFKGLISRRSLFVMVTAEASKEMVLSAYDCEPDDYLTKPLNLKVLEQRLGRLIQQRDALLSVNLALEKHDQAAAIAELEEITSQPGRHTVLAQKLLGQLYLDAERWSEAQQLYQNNLGKRHLDWAQLGAAKVALARGQLDQAEAILTSLIAESRLYLPAYDCLAEVFERQHDAERVLQAVGGAVELSPRSLLRQRKLAKLALEYGENKQALLAARDAVRLGQESCHHQAADALLFLRAAGNTLAAGVEVGSADLADEAKKCLAKLSADRSTEPNELLQGQLLVARVYALNGNEQKAEQLAREALCEVSDPAQLDLGVKLAHHAYLLSIDELADAHHLADHIVAEHGADVLHADQLDKLLAEPKNERNRRRVAELNKTGIAHYKAGELDPALACFRQATLLFPRHIGLQLNYLQTLIGQFKRAPANARLRQKVHSQIAKLKLLITDPSHPQYARLAQLMSGVRSATKAH